MRRIMITTPNCSICRTKKVKFQDLGLPLDEIEADSEQGRILTKKFRLKRAGVIIDLDEMRVLDE